jgi:hypothetical protein
MEVILLALLTEYTQAFTFISVNVAARRCVI